MNNIVSISSQQSETEEEKAFTAQIDEFAKNLIAEATQPGVKLEEKLKVFHEVVAYHGSLRKGKPIPDEGEKGRDKPSFHKFRESVKP